LHNLAAQAYAQAMKTKKLGNSGLEVSTLCFGGNVFGWTADEATSFKLLDAYTEAGGNFIDTADVYSRWVPGNHGGESETIIGKWMKDRGMRKKIVLATKVGMDMGPKKQGLSRDYIISAVEASLKRLQTDVIDLYISHKEDENTPADEVSETYGMLIKHGKIRVCGASNYSAKRLRKSIEISHRNTSPAYQSLQPLYNLYDRSQFENDLQPICEEFGLGVTPYFALASGFLTGKYRSESDLAKSVRGPRMTNYMNERGFKILEALDRVSQEHRTTPSVVALAWLMDRPIVSSAIASARTVEQLKELISATSLKLDPPSLTLLDRVSAPSL
jgi:aryl-alcohol dehydrogenase-like predicted oxidoreductase